MKKCDVSIPTPWLCRRSTGGEQMSEFSPRTDQGPFVGVAALDAP